MGFTWRLMKHISESFRFIPVRHLAVQYGISASTIRRIDQGRWLSPVNWDHLKAILIDGKYLGKRVGFVTHVLNANTREPLDMACASYVLKEEFREIWHAPNPNAGQ